MRVQWRPRDDAPVTLFAHWGEALVFWASVAGLVLLAVIAAIRLADREPAPPAAVAGLEARQTLLTARLDSLGREVATLESRVDSLRAR